MWTGTKAASGERKVYTHKEDSRTTTGRTWNTDSVPLSFCASALSMFVSFVICAVLSPASGCWMVKIGVASVGYVFGNLRDRDDHCTLFVCSMVVEHT